MSLTNREPKFQQIHHEMSEPLNEDHTKTLIAVSVFVTVLITASVCYSAVNPNVLKAFRQYGIPTDFAFVCIPLAVVLLSAFKWFRSASAPIALSISLLVLLGQLQMLRPPQFITQKLISGTETKTNSPVKSGDSTLSQKTQAENLAIPKVTAVTFEHADQLVGFACYTAWSLQSPGRNARISEWRYIAANAQPGTVSTQEVADRRRELLAHIDLVYKNKQLTHLTPRGEVYLAKMRKQLETVH